MSEISNYVQIKGTPEARTAFLQKLERLRKIEEAAKQVMHWLPVRNNYIVHDGSFVTGYINDVEELNKTLTEEKCE